MQTLIELFHAKEAAQAAYSAAWAARRKLDDASVEERVAADLEIERSVKAQSKAVIAYEAALRAALDAEAA